MGPKKKGKKSAKKGSTKDKDSAAPKKEESVVLPVIPSAKTNTLMHTVCMGEGKALTRLVTHYNYGQDLMKTDMNGTTLFHISARRGDIDTMQRLLSFRAQGHPLNINAREIAKIGGYAPLHHAVENGHLSICELLVSAGCDLNIQCNSPLGETALHIIVKTGTNNALKCGQYLIEKGAKKNAIDAFGNSPSFWATSKGNGHMIAELGLASQGAASADDYIKVIMSRIPDFKVPTAGKKGKGGGGKGKKKK